ncbi:hypothetical protein ACPZ19_10535 [Amycolatopsis lurida]
MAPRADAGGEGAVGVADREGHGEPAEWGDTAAGLDALRGQRPELVPALGDRSQHVVVTVDDRGGGGVQAAVHLAGDPLDRGTETEYADHRRDERGDGGEGEREPRSEVHGRRTVYPMPRTVWITGEAPAAASLRRR